MRCAPLCRFGLRLFDASIFGLRHLIFGLWSPFSGLGFRMSGLGFVVVGLGVGFGLVFGDVGTSDHTGGCIRLLSFLNVCGSF